MHSQEGRLSALRQRDNYFARTPRRASHPYRKAETLGVGSMSFTSYSTDRLRLPQLAVIESEAVADVPEDEVRAHAILHAQIGLGTHTREGGMACVGLEAFGG